MARRNALYSVMIYVQVYFVYFVGKEGTAARCRFMYNASGVSSFPFCTVFQKDPSDVFMILAAVVSACMKVVKRRPVLR